MANAYFLVSDTTKSHINITSDYLDDYYLIDNNQLYKTFDSNSLKDYFTLLNDSLLSDLMNYKDDHWKSNYYKTYEYKNISTNLNLRSIEGIKLAARIGVARLTETVLNQQEQLYILNRTLLHGNAREEIMKILKKLGHASVELITTEIHNLSTVYSSVPDTNFSEVTASLDYLMASNLVEHQGANMYCLTFVGELFAVR
ncbi:hypothetical protein [Chitinophaga sp.]|uniref:hypothetical protein n=1 Tax=Chitinophaga sp. TaxID=1869181 RepID=UPI0031DC6A39